jgi:hypothetical protein
MDRKYYKRSFFSISIEKRHQMLEEAISEYWQYIQFVRCVIQDSCLNRDLGQAKVAPFLFKKIKKLDFYARNIANFFADCANRFNFVV